MSKFMRFQWLPLVASICLFPGLAKAIPVNYDISWSGSDGYSLSGMFTYDEVDAIDGSITDGEVQSIFIEVFQNNSSLGTTQVDTALNGFSFNFDTITMSLPARTTPDGNQWNFRKLNGVGFSYGGNASAVSVGTSFLGFTPHANSTISIQKQSTVPLPGTLVLLMAGMLSLLMVTSLRSGHRNIDLPRVRFNGYQFAEARLTGEIRLRSGRCDVLSTLILRIRHAYNQRRTEHL